MDLNNSNRDYCYEPNHWYKTLDVDMSDEKCSYGINLCQTPEFAFNYGVRVFEFLVPIEDNKIKFIKDENKFRCKFAHMTDNEIDPTEFFHKFSDDIRAKLCYLGDFNYERVWNILKEYEKSIVIERNNHFNYEKYWGELTPRQKQDALTTVVLKC